MSRLIDADVLLKELELSKLQPTKDTDGFIDGWCEGFNTVVDMIRSQTTAFDTEKVVEQLEEVKDNACDGISCEECKYTRWCNEGNKAENVAIDKAIDIVKKGGVE